MEAYARLERARLDIARGDVADMHRWLHEAEELARKAGRAYFDQMWGPMLANAQAAFALWEGSYVEALQAAAKDWQRRPVLVTLPAGQNCSPSGWPPPQRGPSERSPTMRLSRPRPPAAAGQRCSRT